MDRRRATRTRLVVVGLVVAAVILAWLALSKTGEASAAAVGCGVDGGSLCSGDLRAMPMQGP